MFIGALALAFTAGVLSVLSPCVLPILPIVLCAATTDRKASPVALAAGLSISFVTVGLFVATIGYSLGLDANVFRYVAASLIIAIGIVLMLPQLQAQLAAASVRESLEQCVAAPFYTVRPILHIEYGIG